jgi:hypothetical protein
MSILVWKQQTWPDMLLHKPETHACSASSIGTTTAVTNLTRLATMTHSHANNDDRLR